jgi:lysophospholipase L1-like esterase
VNFPARRVGIALLAAAVTALPFAVGILKNGWIEIVLLAPIVWFLVASRARERAARLVLLLVSLCLAITVCDIILRPVLGSRLHYSPMNQHQRRLPMLPILGRWDAQVDYSGSVYGDLAAMTGNPEFREARTIEFQTDALGFRNAAVPERVDLLVLGDSFAAGVGVTQTGTFAQALAARHGLSVYNLSYPGGPYDQYLNFSLEAPKLNIAPGAELIWTLFTGNDLDDAGGETWEIAALPWRTGLSAMLVDYRTFRNRSPLRQGWAALRSRWGGISRDVVIRSLPDGRPMLFYGPHEVWGERGRAEVERHSNFPKLLTTLRAMKEAASQKGVRIAIVILPTKGEVYRWVLSPQSSDGGRRPSGFAAAVLAACQQLSLRCWDSKLFLQGEAQRLFASSHDLLWWRDDTHMNELGHQAIASFVAQEIWRNDHARL